MMEPSEQCAYNNDLNPSEDLPSDEERVVVEAKKTSDIRQEDLEQSQQVYSFSEVQESEEETLIKMYGLNFLVTPGSGDGEFYLMVSEGQVGTLECAMEEDEATEDDDNNEGNSSSKIEQECVVSVDNQVEDHGDVKYPTDREVSNEGAYVQALQDSFSSTIALPEEGIKNEKLSNLAAA